MFRFSQDSRIGLFILFALLESLFASLQLRAASPFSSVKEKAWIATGRALFEKGEYEPAISHFNACLSLAGLEDRDKLEANRFLAVLYWYADRNQEAAQSSRKAFELASALGLREEASAIESELVLQEFYSRAIELRNQGDLSGSNLSFKEAWQKSRSIGSNAYEPRILRNWSFNYWGSPKTLKKYLDLNVQAMNLAISLNHKVEACRAAYNIGNYYFIKNDYSYALSYYLRALYYVRDLSPNKDTIVCLNNIASVYISLGDYIKAQDYISEAINFAALRTGVAFRSSLLINLGQAFLSLARSFQEPEYYERALNCFTSYLKMEKKAGGMDLSLHALNGISSIHADRGRLDEAKAILLPVLEKAREDKTSALSDMILLNLALIALKSDKLSEAEKYFTEAQTAAKKDNDFVQMIRAAYGLGRCSELRGDSAQAVASYNEAVNIINSSGSKIANDTGRAEFISRSREPYQALIELYYRLSAESHLEAFGREIYRVSENFRARSFIEYLQRQAQQGNSRPPESAGGPAVDKLNGERLSLLRELSQGARNRAGGEELQSRIKHIDDMLDARLFDQHLQNSGTADLTSPVSLDRLQSSVLTDRTALLEYFLGDERSFLICVTRNAFHLIELPSAQSIYDSLVAYLSFLEDPSIPASKGFLAARRLYAQLFSPAEAFIPGGVDRLVIVPDGILFRLPFETLTPESTGSSRVTYLNDRYVISYSPSASALFYLEQKPDISYKKDVLAFAVSGYARPGNQSGIETYSASSVLDELYKRKGFIIAPIPYARREISDLAKRICREKADIYYGGKATEKTFKGLDLKAYRLIHLACHAFSDDNYPLRSSLVFSVETDNDEDGFLQVSEMYNMRTDADLVVLSACQTGRGKIVRNEGILGLPRVFFYTGARSVISTLWPIHDKAGAVFMDYFYDSYFQGAGKAAALQAAKRKMAGTKYNHPYYWASYTLTGEF